MSGKFRKNYLGSFQAKFIQVIICFHLSHLRFLFQEATYTQYGPITNGSITAHPDTTFFCWTILRVVFSTHERKHVKCERQNKYHKVASTSTSCLEAHAGFSDCL